MRTGLLLLIAAAVLSAGCGKGAAPYSGEGKGTKSESEVNPTASRAANAEPSAKVAEVGEAPRVSAPKLSGKAATASQQLKGSAAPGAYVFDAKSVGYLPNSAEQNVTFQWSMRFQNQLPAQLSEVTVVLQVKSHQSGKEIFRSDPHTFTSFVCDRVPNEGPLEAYSSSSYPSRANFTMPNALWTSDAVLFPLVVATKAVEDEHDLHTSGNLIAFMLKQSDAEVEKAFLKDPSLFKFKNRFGTNPAMIAMAGRSPELVSFMLAHGVPKDGKTTIGHDLMYFAVRSDHAVMLDCASKLGFSVNGRMTRQEQTPLMFAAAGICPLATKWLLKHGADPNVVDKSGSTALSLCIESRTEENETAFNDLVAAKANVHYRFSSGNTLLHDAIASSNLWCATRLLKLGVSVNAGNNNKLTPLMAAAGNGSNELAKWLVDHGADVHAVDAKGQTVFDYAKMSNTLQTDRFFREAVGL